MARDRAKDLSVGALLALALIIVALTVMTVGGDSQLFASKSFYTVFFSDTTGLSRGSPVKMSGVRVGTVTAIRLPTDPESKGIEVTVGVDQVYSARIREDSTAALRILQMLSGEKYVEIDPGSADRDELAEGSVIEPQQDPELLEQAAEAAENLTEITVSLKNILRSIERGEGLIGRMFTDPRFGTEGIESLGQTMINLQRITEDLIRGRSADGSGFVSRMLYDETFAARIDDLEQAIGHFARLMQAVDPEKGVLGAMLQEGGTGEQALEDLRGAAASLRRVAERLESPDGMLGKLINDGEYSAGLARDLESILGNLAEISDKLNRGEGTLGALINDRELHDSMEQVVTGLNDSKFARWLMRRYQKKGIKAEEAGGAE